MKLGVCLPNYGQTLSTTAVRAVANEAERLGYDSVWSTDHLLMQRNSGTPYERIFDSITTLGYVAGITSKVRLGISSLITAMRNPVAVAKQLATIDNLSNGRIILATSVGWNEKEFSNLAANFHDRGRRLDASIRLMRALWSGETRFKSRILNLQLEDVVFEPRPIHDKIPIWIAGNSRFAMRRAARLGDAWHPNLFPLDTFKGMVDDFRQSFPEARRMPLTVRIGLNPKSELSEYKSPQGERRVILSSNRPQNRDLLRKLAEIGVEYAVVAPNPDGRVPLADQLEGMRKVVEDSA